MDYVFYFRQAKEAKSINSRRIEEDCSLGKKCYSDCLECSYYVGRNGQYILCKEGIDMEVLESRKGSPHDDLLSDIRQVKKHCTSDRFDYENGWGEMCYLVWTALDIADELREAVLVVRQQGGSVIRGNDIPDFYKPVIKEQLERIKRSIG